MIAIPPNHRPSLFWRTFLLLCSLIFFSVVGWLQSFRVLSELPYSQGVAQHIVSTANLTRYALVTADPLYRKDLLTVLAAREELLISPRERSVRGKPLPIDGFNSLIEQLVKANLGQSTVLAAEVNGVKGLWVSVDIDGDAFLPQAEEILAGFEEDIQTYGIGSIGELFDAEPPFAPRGAISQARSVAAVLDIYGMILARKPEEKPGKSEKISKKANPKTAKAAENVGKKGVAAKAGKPAAKAAKRPKKETAPRRKAKLTLNILVTILRGAGRLTKAVFGSLRVTKIRVCLGVRGEDPAEAARAYGRLNAWLYSSLGVIDRFVYLDFDELRILPDFGSAEPTVADRVSFHLSARLLFIVAATLRVLYEFWREKVLDVFL